MSWRFHKRKWRLQRTPRSSRGSLLKGDEPVLTPAATAQFDAINDYLKGRGYGFELDRFYTYKFPFPTNGNGYEVAFLSRQDCHPGLRIPGG